MVYYFKFLQEKPFGSVAVILASSILGILGSYGVAWFGIRINTNANSRAAFASLRGNSLKTLFIPLQAGMSIGLLLVCVELVCMICILLFDPADLAGPCFIGFAIGESLGASVLRIGGGIFTKIADIGSDLMKIVFNLPEDDPKNPGVIADCTGDNAGDSVGPTADGFETYGVTGVALIAFLALALAHCRRCCAAKLIIWMFAIQALMVLASLGSFYFNMAVANFALRRQKEFQLGSAAHRPGLDHLHRFHPRSVSSRASFCSAISRDADAAHLHAYRISGGCCPPSSAAARSPARSSWSSRKFSSAPNRGTSRNVTASDHGGASLNVLSGFVAGNFSAFWMGLVILALMFTAFLFSQNADFIALIPGAIRFRRADFRLRPGRVWFSRDGAGDHCRGQLRPRHRQRAVRL